MSLPVDERQPIPSVRAVATLINGGAVYAPKASPQKVAAGTHNGGSGKDLLDESVLLKAMLTCAQARAKTSLPHRLTCARCL